MGTNRIATRQRNGLTVAQVGGNDVYKMLSQIRSIVELAGLGEEYAVFFAEPVESHTQIDWYADAEGSVQQVSSLPKNEQDKALEQFRTMTRNLQAYAATMKEKSGYRSYADMLEKALLIPDLDCLFLVGGHPVLTSWGLTSCDIGIVEDVDIVAMIEKELKKEKPEPSGNRETETVTSPIEELQRQAQEEQDILKPEEATKEKKEEEEEKRTPEEAKPSILPKLFGLLVLLAIAVAIIWFYLSNSDPRADMSFLKDRIEISSVLEDANGKHVTLRMDFPDSTGIGMAYILPVDSQEQACHGEVNATLDGGNVLFQVNELICPDKDNHEPFSITCPRNSKNCVGANKNGQTWAVEIEIEK